MRCWTGDTITKLEPNYIFVFGSNPEGRHGAGAAKAALKFGAKYGIGRGLQGQTYALVTKNLKEGFGKIEHEQLKALSKECDNTAIISNHWTPYTEDLYSDADEVYIFDVQRTISSDGNNRKKVQECVVVYY